MRPQVNMVLVVNWHLILFSYISPVSLAPPTEIQKLFLTILNLKVDWNQGSNIGHPMPQAVALPTVQSRIGFTTVLLLG